MSRIEVYKCDHCGKLFPIEHDKEKCKRIYVSHLKKHVRERIKNRKEENSRKYVIDGLKSKNLRFTDIESIKKYNPEDMISNWIYVCIGHHEKFQYSLKLVEYFKKRGKIGYRLSYDIDTNFYIRRLYTLDSDHNSISYNTNCNSRIILEVVLGDYDENGTYSDICRAWKKIFLRSKLKSNSNKFTRTTFTIWKESDDKIDDV